MFIVEVLLKVLSWVISLSWGMWLFWTIVEIRFQWEYLLYGLPALVFFWLTSKARQRRELMADDEKLLKRYQKQRRRK